MKYFIGYIPIAKPLPLSTFTRRTRTKKANIKWNIKSLHRFGNFIKLKENNQITSDYQILRKCLLGDIGDIITLPNDSYISERIKVNGGWETDLSYFISRRITANHTLLDLGAHAGLVSLQVFHLNPLSCQNIYACEPLLENFLALSRNSSRLTNTSNITVHLVNSAVSEYRNKTIKFYSEMGATMNSSISKNISKHTDSVKELQVNNQHFSEFYENFLDTIQSNRICIKSDIQGSDVKILGNAPKDFWDKVDFGVIEISSGSNQKIEDIVHLFSKMKDFTNFYTDPFLKNRVSKKFVSDFYTSNANKYMNLYFSKI